jgi:hypothetical protein
MKVDDGKFIAPLPNNKRNKNKYREDIMVLEQNSG